MVTQQVYTENKPVTTKEKEQAQVDALADLQLESAEDTFNALSTTLSYNELSSNLKKEVRNYKKQNQLTQDVADQIAQMHRNEAAAKVAKRINKPEASLFAEESKAERKAKEVRMEEEGAFESTNITYRYPELSLSAFQKQFGEDKTVGQALKRLLKQKKSKNFPGLNIPQKILINALLKIPGIAEMNFGVFKHPDSRRGNKLQRYEEIRAVVGERQVPKTTPIKDANGRVIGESDVFYETEPIFGGEYDEKTNIVKLYQSSSVNTLLHEVVHAATVKVLKNNIINGVGVTPLGKKIMRIYNAAQEAADSKSKRYGLENVYEFIAEAFTNPEFQTFLANQASITGAKPSLRSKLTSLFNDLFSAIKDMLGIPKAAQSLLGDVFDLSSPLFKGPNVELTAAAKVAADLAMEPTSHYSMSMPASDTAASIDLMNSPNLIYSKLPTFNDGIVDRGKDVISKLPSLARKVFLGFTSLGDLNELYGKILPSIKKLDIALKLRNNTHRELKEKIDHVANKALQALKGKSPAIVKKFNFVAHELSRLNIDPRPGKGNDNHPMVQAWRALPPELQKAGIDIVESYEEFVDKMIKFLQSESPTRAQEIRDKFESKKLPFYFPFLRQGNYWIQFTDNNNETVSLAYDNPRQQKMMNDYLTSVKAKDLRMFNRVDQITRKSAPPVGFMSDIIKIMEQGGASPEVIDKAYQTYITLFPAESIRQQFRQREGNLGFIGDVVQGYATTAPKMATQLANLQHGKAIDEAYSDVENEARNDSSEIAANVMQELSKRRDFFSNPVASSWVYGASNVNFFWSIAGNVSSALVNLTILPTVVLPQLAINPITGKYEYGKAYAALNEARSLFFKGGKDKSREFLSIRTFGENPNLSPDLKRLHERAIEMGAIQYSVGRDLADIRKAPSDQYSDFSHKMQTSLGLIFEGTERFNREVTLIAAYKLARNNGMNEAEAIDHALRFTSKIHTEAVPEAGARYLQAGFPKVALIFKRFAMAQIFNIYTLFNAAKNGMNPMEKKVARRQLIGIYGMNFALAGLQGVPLYGAVQVLANMLLADDDEPYDLDQEVRESFGMLGYKGPANLIFGVDIASRTGFNGMVWRDDPKRLAEVGYTSYFIEHFLGPTFSTGKTVLQDGPAMMANGQYERGLEKMLPSFLKNPLKAMRYATEGAKNPNGASLVDDVSGYNQFMQIFGFTPQNVSEAYAKAGSMKQADKKLMDRRDGLLDALYLARTNGDIEQMGRIQEKINRYNERNPLPPYVLKPSSVSRSMKARDKALDESVYGVHFSPKALQQLEEKYGN
jgi:dihydroneopterin aldolase